MERGKTKEEPWNAATVEIAEDSEEHLHMVRTNPSIMDDGAKMLYNT